MIPHSDFKITFLKEAPPTLQKKGNSLTLNLSFSLPESLFITFVKPLVESGIKKHLIYLSADQETQDSFKNWTAKVFKPKQFSSEELDLMAIISSIWQKAKAFVDNQLKICENQKLIKDEGEWQKNADSFNLVFQSQGMLGKVFTTRQANLLLETANNLAK